MDTQLPPRQLGTAGDGAAPQVPRRVRALSSAAQTAGALNDDGFTTAMELALTPLVFGAVGFAVDRAVGLTPLFTIVLSLWAFTVVAWMTWRRYDEKMTRLEGELPAQALRSRGRVA